MYFCVYFNSRFKFFSDELCKGGAVSCNDQVKSAPLIEFSNLYSIVQETRNLQYLNLSYNAFREEGGMLLGEALSYNDGLEELDLTWNHLRRKGAIGLAEGLMVSFRLAKNICGSLILQIWYGHIR